MMKRIPNSIGSMKVVLNDVEKKIRTLLLHVGRFIDESGEVQPRFKDEPTVLRISGGWVRDKLLGIDSHDIDIAINNMTGYQFGLSLRRFASSQENIRNFGLEDSVNTLHVIKANPEKSKHLETATTKIYGYDIDLVNLRKEAYPDDSRNPVVEFGTASEDAFRRDATINALFYNLNTEQVEDFTQKGLEDMKNHLIRTPLDPTVTFEDDPLRVLRLIRFASRLNFEIESAVFDAMSESTIKDAFIKKISRERVGTEIEKMLRGPDPRRSLELIDRAGLYKCIFSGGCGYDFEAETENWKKVYDYAESVLKADDGSPSLKILQSFLFPTPENLYHFWVIAAIMPCAAGPQPSTKKPGKKRAFAVEVARESIKTPNSVSDVILSSINNFDDIRSVKDSLYPLRTRNSSLAEANAGSRQTLGMAVRRWGPSWLTQIGFALLYEIYMDNRSQMSRKVIDARRLP